MQKVKTAIALPINESIASSLHPLDGSGSSTNTTPPASAVTPKDAITNNAEEVRQEVIVMSQNAH